MLDMSDMSDKPYMPEIKEVIIAFDFLKAYFKGIVKVHGNWYYGCGDYYNLKDELLNQDEYISGCIFDKKSLYINFLKSDWAGFATSNGKLMDGNVYELYSYDYEYDYKYNDLIFDREEIGTFLMKFLPITGELSDINGKLNIISDIFPEYNNGDKRMEREDDSMEYLRRVQKEQKVKKLRG